MQTILVIEDNEGIRENIAEVLELAKYKVHTAKNGKEGVEVAINRKPDLIVCDIMMPELDGYGVIHMLQKNSDTQHIPFIFLTAKAERTEMRKGMELGADDYITKPFSSTELLNAIESRLKKSDLIKEKLSGLDGLDKLINSVSGNEALRDLIKNRTNTKFRKKQAIYAERSHPIDLFYVESGKIKAYKINEDGKELIIGLYNAGDFFGYTALLEGTLYKESADALEESSVVAISKKEFDELLNNNREVMLKFIQLLANNISDKEQQLLNLAYNSVRKRIADALITLSKKYKHENDSQFAIHISRENLANLAGTATESLIRTLSDFKDEKLISIKDGNIVILNEKKLSTMLN